MMKRTCLYSTATFLWTLHLCAPFEAIAMGGGKGKGEDQKEQNYVPVRSATENREAAVSSSPPPPPPSAQAPTVTAAVAVNLTPADQDVIKKNSAAKPFAIKLRQAEKAHHDAKAVVNQATTALEEFISTGEYEGRDLYAQSLYEAYQAINPAHYETSEELAEKRRTAHKNAQNALQKASPAYKKLMEAVNKAKEAVNVAKTTVDQAAEDYRKIVSQSH